MKKFFKKMPIWLLSCVMVGFTACSEEEQNGNGTGSGGGSETEIGTGTQPDLPSLGITDPVVAIDYFNGVTTLNYADGKLTGGYDCQVNGNINIIHSPLKICANLTSSEGNVEIVYSNIQTNEFGCIVSADVFTKYLSPDSSIVAEVKAYLKAEYKDEVYLSQISTEMPIESSGISLNSKMDVTFEWNNGNVVKNTWRESYYINNQLEEEYSDTEMYTYAEDAPLNNGIYWNATMFDSEVIAYAGFWGKTTKNIPSSYILLNDDGTVDYESSISVDLDEKGRVVTWYENGYPSCNYQYADTHHTVNQRGVLQNVMNRKMNNRWLNFLYKSIAK